MRIPHGASIAGPALSARFRIESNRDGKPLDRDSRALMHQREKSITAKITFGTERDGYRTNDYWFDHVLTPKPLSEEDLRMTIG